MYYGNQIRAFQNNELPLQDSSTFGICTSPCKEWLFAFLFILTTICIDHLVRQFDLNGQKMRWMTECGH